VRRLLLTGATGFIGSHCLPLLVEAGYEVHAVVRDSVESGDQRVHWHRADLLDSEKVHTLLGQIKPSHLLHLAWYVVPGNFLTSTENLLWLEAGLNLVREFADWGGRRSVLAGTCFEYAPSTEPLVEGVTPLAPSSLYGACKSALHTASAAYLNERGVSHAWAHVFYLYGPGDHPSKLVPSLIRALAVGDDFSCRSPHDIRDFLYVGDVAAALVALLGEPVEGAVNICSGEPTTVGDLVAAVARELGQKRMVDYCATESGGSRIVGDNGRLRRDVGWLPAHTLGALSGL
jgi:nucleoside-diphosphate-sugar epimerase